MFLECNQDEIVDLQTWNAERSPIEVSHPDLIVFHYISIVNVTLQQDEIQSNFICTLSILAF